jgi:plasmid stabilization system protein ParE
VRRAVVVSEPAEQQLRAIDDWWRRNRLAATELFAQEFASAIDTLAAHPGVGAPVRRRKFKGLRRFLLRATRYHVYYVTTDRTVTVLAVWSAVRGNGPPIESLSPPK